MHAAGAGQCGNQRYRQVGLGGRRLDTALAYVYDPGSDSWKEVSE